MEIMVTDYSSPLHKQVTMRSAASYGSNEAREQVPSCVGHCGAWRESVLRPPLPFRVLDVTLRPLNDTESNAFRFMLDIVSRGALAKFIKYKNAFVLLKASITVLFMFAHAFFKLSTSFCIRCRHELRQSSQQW